MRKEGKLVVVLDDKASVKLEGTQVETKSSVFKSVGSCNNHLKTVFIACCWVQIIRSQNNILKYKKKTRKDILRLSFNYNTFVYFKTIVIQTK